MLVLTIVTWVLSGLLALLNLLAGGTKLAKPRGGEKPMATLRDYTPTQVRLIGAAEVLAAAGLILPPLTGILPILAPLAAIGIAIIQFLAIFAHRKHGEGFVPNIVLLIVALAVATLRFSAL